MINALGLLLLMSPAAPAADLSARTLSVPQQLAAPALPALPQPQALPEGAPPAPPARAASLAPSQPELIRLEAAKPKDAPAVSRAVFDGAKLPSASEPVAESAPAPVPTLAPAARPRPIFRRVKPSKGNGQRGFAKADLLAYLGAAAVAGLALGTVVFAFKLSPWIGLLAVGSFAYLIRSIARNQREQRAPKDISMPPEPHVAASGELPALPELRGQLEGALDHLIRSNPIKNRDIGEISRGLARAANEMELRGGFQGPRGWTPVDPRLLQAVELPDILHRLLSRNPPREGVGPHNFLAQLEQLFEGLRAEATRAQSSQDLVDKLKWWPSHYRQFIP